MIELTGVDKIYGRGAGQVSALKNVSIALAPGELLVLSGKSGSGKTSLLQIAGLIDTPTRGTVLIDGVDARTLSDSARTRLRAHKIGFVFQTFNLISCLTAAENVEAALVVGHPMTSSDRALRAMELLASVGLEQRRHHLPSQLSGGEQQRVAIARALANAPAHILADEPTGNLDQATGVSIMTLLRSLVERSGIGVVVVTHDLSAVAFSTRWAVLTDGVLSIKAQEEVVRVAQIVGPGVE